MSAADLEALWEALHNGTLPEVLAIVEELDDPEALAIVGELTRAEISCRQTIARRRKALRIWRNGRLNEWLELIDSLSLDAVRMGAYYARELRDDPDRWRMLGSLHADLARAKYAAALFGVEDEARWAALWLAERRGELITPEELR